MIAVVHTGGYAVIQDSCSGMKIEFLLSTAINYLYSFEHTEKVDFLCLLCSEMRANKCFLICLPNWFSMCLDSDKEIMPLCYKHVIAMSFHKIRAKFQ